MKCKRKILSPHFLLKITDYLSYFSIPNYHMYHHLFIYLFGVFYYISCVHTFIFVNGNDVALNVGICFNYSVMNIINKSSHSSTLYTASIMNSVGYGSQHFLVYMIPICYLIGANIRMRFLVIYSSIEE
jgi:hypothetical protein